jgi:hypothetical protein
MITADNCSEIRIKGQCSFTPAPLAVLRLGAVQGRSPALPFILSLSGGKVILNYPNFQIILKKFLIPVLKYSRIQLLRRNKDRLSRCHSRSGQQSGIYRAE